jgi:hypothetical protein
MPPSSTKQVACAAEAGWKNKYALGLDAIGLIPGEGNVFSAGQLVASGVGAIYSAATKDPVGAGLGLTSYHVTSLAIAGTERGAPQFLKVLPGVGTALSFYQLYHDLRFGEFMSDYNACMARS